MKTCPLDDFNAQQLLSRTFLKNIVLLGNGEGNQDLISLMLS